MRFSLSFHIYFGYKEKEKRQLIPETSWHNPSPGDVFWGEQQKEIKSFKCYKLRKWFEEHPIFDNSEQNPWKIMLGHLVQVDLIIMLL